MKPFALFLAFLIGVIAGIVVLPHSSHSDGGIGLAAPVHTNVIYIAPPTISRFYISPHAPSELKELGDKDGIDYIPAQFTNGQLRAFRGDGIRNEDFVGFGMQVYAPISGLVMRVKHPNGVNVLGEMSGSEVGFVAIQSPGGEVVLLAHLAKIQVTEGSKIQVGEPIGIISNNGSSRNPHIHLGAYRKSSSLVIEFDRNALDATLSKVDQLERQASR